MTDAPEAPNADEGLFADRDDDGMPDAFEKILVLAMTLVAASVARKVAGAVWQASTGRTPPSGEDDKGDAVVVLLWGAAAGAAVGAARLVAERQARAYARHRRA